MSTVEFILLIYGALITVIGVAFLATIVGEAKGYDA